MMLARLAEKSDEERFTQHGMKNRSWKISFSGVSCFRVGPFPLMLRSFFFLVCCSSFEVGSLSTQQNKGRSYIPTISSSFPFAPRVASSRGNLRRGPFSRKFFVGLCYFSWWVPKWDRERMQWEKKRSLFIQMDLVLGFLGKTSQQEPIWFMTLSALCCALWWSKGPIVPSICDRFYST